MGRDTRTTFENENPEGTFFPSKLDVIARGHKIADFMHVLCQSSRAATVADAKT